MFSISPVPRKVGFNVPFPLDDIRTIDGAAIQRIAISLVNREPMYSYQIFLYGHPCGQYYGKKKIYVTYNFWLKTV